MLVWESRYFRGPFYKDCWALGTMQARTVAVQFTTASPVSGTTLGIRWVPLKCGQGEWMNWCGLRKNCAHGVRGL